MTTCKRMHIPCTLVGMLSLSHLLSAGSLRRLTGRSGALPGLLKSGALSPPAGWHTHPAGTPTLGPLPFMGGHVCAGTGPGLPGGGSESWHLDSRLPACPLAWPRPSAQPGGEGRGLEAGLSLLRAALALLWAGAVDSSPSPVLGKNIKSRRQAASN